MKMEETVGDVPIILICYQFCYLWGEAEGGEKRAHDAPQPNICIPPGLDKPAAPLVIIPTPFTEGSGSH